MPSIKYEDIFSDFLGNVSDYQIASLNMSDAYELMTEYLQKSLRQSYVRDLFKTLICDDEIQSLSYELEYEIDEERDREFIIGVLSKGMTLEWIKPQVRNKVNIMQLFGNKEGKFFAQQAHVSEMRGLQEEIRLELRKEIRDRSNIHNGYLGGNK